MRQICSITIHDEIVSSADVLLNLTLFPPGSRPTVGDILQFAAVNRPADVMNAPENHAKNDDGPTKLMANLGNSLGDHEGDSNDASIDHGKGYYFVVKEMDIEQASNSAGSKVI